MASALPWQPDRLRGMGTVKDRPGIYREWFFAYQRDQRRHMPRNLPASAGKETGKTASHFMDPGRSGHWNRTENVTLTARAFLVFKPGRLLFLILFLTALPLSFLQGLAGNGPKIQAGNRPIWAISLPVLLKQVFIHLPVMVQDLHSFQDRAVPIT